MKFDRGSPRAWLIFIVTGFNIVVASAIAMLSPRKSRDRRHAVMSGHMFNGNLRAFYDSVGRDAVKWEFRYAYIDLDAYRSRKVGDVAALSSVRLDHMIWMARADVVMTDHGPGIWSLLQILRPQIAFVEVWHGIGFKGLRPDLGREIARYRALFAASDWDGSDSLGKRERDIAPEVIATGYAAVDSLARPQGIDAVSDGYGLESERSGQVLIAPTWSHGDRDRSLFPFGLDAAEFFTGLDKWARKANWTVIFRSHLNAPGVAPGTYPNIRFMPLKEYPLTYELLAASDVLVTDWSSIATDYLVLGRPIVFLDVPPPFTPAHLSADDRVGYRVSSWRDLEETLTVASQRPEEYAESFGRERVRVLSKAFDSTLDGRSSERYLEALDRIASSESI